MAALPQLSPSPKWYERFPRAAPLVLFALAMALTGTSVVAIEHVDAERRQAQVREVAGVVASSLARRANTHSAYLHAAALLMASQPNMGPQGFAGLAAELQNDEEYRGGSLTWAARIGPGQVPAFEAARRAEGLAGYAVHPRPAAGQGSLVPVTWIDQLTERKRPALGYDMYSEPARRAAMDRAAQENRPVSTGPIQLLLDRDRSPRERTAWSSFLVYMPVLAPIGAPRAQQHLLGFLAAPFNARAFLTSAIAPGQTRGLALRLYDGAATPDRLMASVGPELSAAALVVAEAPVVVAQRRLVLQVAQPDAEPLTGMALLTLALGTLVAGLAAAMVRLVLAQAAEDHAALAWLREQESIRQSLTRELNHRVKNTLANVLSILALTRRRAQGLDEFAEALEGRIRALSATHDLLTESDWGQTPLRAVLAAEMAPYTCAADHVIEIEGPDVVLAPNDALSFGLAIHELATNAAKYGALSVASGRVRIDWEQTGPDSVAVRWRESGGPQVAPPAKRGFGTELIERVVSAELGGGVRLDFRPGGVECRLVLPVRRPAAFQIRACSAQAATGA